METQAGRQDRWPQVPSALGLVTLTLGTLEVYELKYLQPRLPPSFQGTYIPSACLPWSYDPGQPLVCGPL